MITLYAAVLVVYGIIGPAKASAGVGAEGDFQSAQSGRINAELLRCGPIALQLCSAICDRPLSADAIDQYFEPGSDENTLAEVHDAAHAVGLKALAIKWRGTLPPPNAPPAVIPIVNARGRRHFVAMAACRDNVALIVDVPQQPAWVSEEVLRTRLNWQGQALHIAASDSPLADLRGEVESRGRYSAAAPWLVTAAVASLCVAVRILRRRRQAVRTIRDVRSLA